MYLKNPINIDYDNGIGLAIDSIEGLGPVEADINTTEMVSDGDLFNSARVGKRNIVLNLAFYAESGNGIETARRYSYQLFPIKQLLNIEIETDTRIVYTKGYVEKNEPLIFSNMCTTQISIICPDPKLYDYTEEIGTHDITVETVDILNNQYHGFDYQGEVGTGCVLNFTFGSDVEASLAEGAPAFNFAFSNIIDGSLASVSVYPPTASEEHPNDGFKAGDILTISSVVGNKYCILTTSESETIVSYNALNLLNQNPDWVIIKPGGTNATITDPSQVLSDAILTMNICYEGV
jgi:hypothetical protein